ncbi:hypothetical protein CH063_01321 [Colletotrichum higginsianum]|uniref:Uncharacterized protein n=1 Tax=Colletotrichum higginsianum (strain IMI 349063) TaxID=759273 RepID=H1V5I2_COLHI|nr:hypothetical protein CH063_01321 [Colletotrichum higginsianum]
MQAPDSMPSRSIQASPNTCLISLPPPLLLVSPRSSSKSRERPMSDSDSSMFLPPFPVFYASAHSFRPASPSDSVCNPVRAIASSSRERQ